MVEQRETLKRERRASAVAQEALQARAILGGGLVQGLGAEASREKPVVSQGSTSRTSSRSIGPRRANQRSTRPRTGAATAARALRPQALAGRNWTSPSEPEPPSNTPSRTPQWKWTWRFSDAPNRCTKLSRPEPCARGDPRTGLLQVALDHPQDDVEHRTEGLGFALQALAQPFGSICTALKSSARSGGSSPMNFLFTPSPRSRAFNWIQVSRMAGLLTSQLRSSVRDDQAGVFPWRGARGHFT